MEMSSSSKDSKILFLSYSTFSEIREKGKDERFLKMHGPADFFNEVHFLQSPTERRGIERPFLGFFVHKTSTLCSDSRLFKNLSFIRILKKAIEIVNKEDIDIIEALNPYLPGLVGSIAKKLTKSPFVLYLLNDYKSSLQIQGKGIFERKLGETIERFNVSSATKVFVLSPFLKKYAVEHGADPEDVEVIPLGVDLDSFRKDEDLRKKIRSEFGAKKDYLLLLFVGRLAGQKDPLTLLRIYQIVKEADSRFKLIIVGGGPLRDKMEKFINKRGLKDITFTGFVGHDEVASIMNASDIFLFPTLHEGFGNVLIEAQASGLPIVTTNIPHLSGIVDEKSALTFEPGNAREGAEQVLKLLDLGLRKKLMEKSFTNAKNFSLDKRQERLRKVHLQILEEVRK